MNPDPKADASIPHAPSPARRALAWLWLATQVVACQALPLGGQIKVTDAPAGLHAASALSSRLLAEIGAAPCDADSQCKTLAVGEKACGGPERWLAWSSTTSRADRLLALAGESVALARQRQAVSGMLSDCRYNADPGAQCQQGVCTLRSSSGAR